MTKHFHMTNSVERFAGRSRGPHHKIALSGGQFALLSTFRACRVTLHGLRQSHSLQVEGVVLYIIHALSNSLVNTLEVWR